MNNGVRVSIILAVVTIALLGLYYASLDDPAATVASTSDVPPTEVILESDLMEPELEPELVIVGEPESIESAPTPEAEEPPIESSPQMFEEAMVEAEPESEMSDAERGLAESAAVLEDVPAPTMEPGSDAVAALDAEADAEMSAANLGDPESTASERGAAPLPREPMPSEPTDSMPASEPSEPVVDIPAEPSQPGRSRNGIAPTREPGRSVNSTGVGMHRVVAPGDADVDLNRAVGLLQSRDGGQVVDEAGATAWLVVPEGMVDGLSEIAITETQAGDTLVLVRTDTRGSLGLSGDVSSARVVLEPDGIHHGVNFRIKPQAIADVSAASRGLIRVPIVWVQDGNIVFAETRRISISGQGRIAGRFDRATADRLAAGLLAEPGVMSGDEPSSPTAEADVATPASAPTIVTSNPGGLPADAYVEYTIKDGDSFALIAREWFGDESRFSDIGLANPLVDPLKLQKGQVIRLPPKDMPRRVVVAPANPAGVRIHVVGSGESLSEIALAAYGKSSRWREIYEANKDVIGPDSGKLTVGMELVIP